MLSKRNQALKIAVLNPEAIPEAKKRLTKIVYQKYLESLSKKQE